MTTRDQLTAFLDTLLLAPAKCVDGSNNGLQVEGRAEIAKVVFGVDACLALFEQAAAAGADYLVVHHGLSWKDSLKYLTRLNAARVGSLFRHGLSLYAAHLPLDMHPEVGHNAIIAKGLELQSPTPCFEYGGARIGFAGDLPHPLPLATLAAKVDALLGTRSLVWECGAPTVTRVGVVSGGGADALQECPAAAVDCLVTGEVAHQHWHVARECQVNLIAAGHYRSEIPGLLAVMERVQAHFELDCAFLDLPTGM